MNESDRSMKSLSLNGTWLAKQAGENETVPGTVPGCIHTDLLAAGKINDPFYRTQEFDSYWVGETDWEYSRRFEVTDELLAHAKVTLVCHGLDTLATIHVNGMEIGRTDNMFRRYEFDILNSLTSGSNSISIRFASALNYTIRKEAERHLPGWNSGEKIGYHGYIRKEQCNFGWDWGIRTVTCGIWRDIELVASNGVRLDDVHIGQEHGIGGTVKLTVNVQANSSGERELLSTVRLRFEGETVAESNAPVCAGTSTMKLSVPEPQLWWPNNMGEQPLYDVDVTLEDATGIEVDRWTRRIGLRTLHLDRHTDEWGESFQFVVNDVPFFAKGANWIPADAYNNRVTPERYRDLVSSSADVNMNMLRVWGGGLYEEDVFYDLCDEYGICVWQDFMFACFTYPTFDDAFMATVEQEAIDNVRRLRHHASLALWCGNNELEQGLVDVEWTDVSMSWEDYSKLYDTMLPRIVAEHDGQTDYWPASPHTPGMDRADHSNPARGDAHLWDVWHGLKPFEWYRTCEHRFNSEFGFQSFPEPKTTHSYTEHQDRNITSFVMEHHQRSGIGNSIIMHYMLNWFRLPVGFEATLWTSQILQGMAMKYAVEHWRRSMPRGMGTIFWQLNDMWPVASWASIDYHHRWKALHFMARRFFAPLLVSGLEDVDKGTVEIHLTSDALLPRDVTLQWHITDASGNEIEAGEQEVQTGSNANRLAHTLHLKHLLDEHGPRDLIVWLEAYEQKKLLSENLVLFARPKHLELSREPGTTARVSANGGDAGFVVTMTTKQAALWTWIELADSDFRAHDNFVHLRPGTSVNLEVMPSETMTAAALQKRLVVRSLIDLSQER